MGKTKYILAILFTANAYAICNDPISRLNINPGQIPTSSKYNQDFNNLYDKANDLSGDCIADNSIQSDQINDGAITTDKVLDGSVTFAKFDPTAGPAYRKPLRIRAYTANSSWVLPNEVGSVFVQVVGGGGGTRGEVVGGGSSGTASSFGAYCVAGGGSLATSSTGGAGGTATSGNLNFSGGAGISSSLNNNCFSYFNPDTENFETAICKWGGNGGASMLGNYGRGGELPTVATNGGGGAGAYCARLLQRAELSNPVAITVGSGGTTTSSESPNPGRNGGAGIVIIYEYSQED